MTTPFDRIMLEHGGGGLLSHELVTKTFLPLLKNPWLEELQDGAVFEVGEIKLCFTTDSFVVQPRFFPGGDIGSLAVHGTVNDIAMCGGIPLAMSAGFILEEGFPMEELERIVRSMAGAAKSAGVVIATGDTKVVPRGAADGLFINTSGIGVIRYGGVISVRSIRPGDAVLVSGPIGDHGAAVLSARQDLGFSSKILSDSAPLNGLVETILAASPDVHCMRDPTRGGLGAILAEIAGQSGMRITIRETAIPVRSEVRGICEILGFDPLFLANEGRMALFCSAESAETVLRAMRGHELGREAAVIGAVAEDRRGRVVLETLIGGSREIDLPTGELVPRIC
ncbi:MAG: hydrogenase expression/formation protein HypE [Deltaproteobacteria bacterium]|nr:hydrogenase expression/formation protein HypE [Deltaproteobacteria bacterium]